MGIAFKKQRRALIMGAAGRDFHNFNVYFRENPFYRVICFTAAQIPSIANRTYPPSLAGRRYPNGIPIYSEDKLEELIERFGVDDVFLCYSDLSHEEVMHKACRVQSKGANFVLLGPKETMLKAKKPVIAVTGVRTGVGKSVISSKVAEYLQAKGKRVVVVRHPMPYRSFKALEVFKSDRDLSSLTFEEKEDYRRHIEKGRVVLAGVDYEKVLKQAEKFDVIVWDGGNNDWPFFVPDLHIVVADALREGHEISYYPGETNFRMADIVIVSKSEYGGREIEERAKKLKKVVYKARSRLIANVPSSVKSAVVVEDGPTLTHGGMKWGAAYLFAKNKGIKVVDARRMAVGEVKKVMERYDLISVPAVGYTKKQEEDLIRTLNRVRADAVLSSSPALLKGVNKPVYRIDYDFTLSSSFFRRLDVFV